jgi:hypothetical protein
LFFYTRPSIHSQIASLDNCGLGDVAVCALASRVLGRHIGLTYVDLKHNNLSDVAAEALGKALATNRKLKDLWLVRCFRGDGASIPLTFCQLDQQSDNGRRLQALGCAAWRQQQDACPH